MIFLLSLIFYITNFLACIFQIKFVASVVVTLVFKYNKYCHGLLLRLLSVCRIHWIARISAIISLEKGMRVSHRWPFFNKLENACSLWVAHEGLANLVFTYVIWQLIGIALLIIIFLNSFFFFNTLCICTVLTSPIVAFVCQWKLILEFRGSCFRLENSVAMLFVTALQYVFCILLFNKHSC